MKPRFSSRITAQTIVPSLVVLLTLVPLCNSRLLAEIEGLVSLKGTEWTLEQREAARKAQTARKHHDRRISEDEESRLARRRESFHKISLARRVRSASHVR